MYLEKTPKENDAFKTYVNKCAIILSYIKPLTSLLLKILKYLDMKRISRSFVGQSKKE